MTSLSAPSLETSTNNPKTSHEDEPPVSALLLKRGLSLAKLNAATQSIDRIDSSYSTEDVRKSLDLSDDEDLRNLSGIVTIDSMFCELLMKLGVDSAKREDMMSCLSVEEKRAHVITGQSVLDDDPHFSKADEEMISVMDVQRFVDSVRLLTMKKRIFTASKDWMRAFCASGGISVIIENMDNRLEEYPKRESTAAALYELLLCIREVMKTDGLSVAIGTRGAIDAFVMSLDFDYKSLSLQVLELLSVTCFSGGPMAVWQIVHGIHHLAHIRQERPFEILINALNSSLIDEEVQAAILEFIATLVMSQTEIQDRMKIRNELQALHFQQIYTGVLNVMLNSMDGNNNNSSTSSPTNSNGSPRGTPVKQSSVSNMSGTRTTVATPRGVPIRQRSARMLLSMNVSIASMSVMGSTLGEGDGEMGAELDSFISPRNGVKTQRWSKQLSSAAAAATAAAASVFRHSLRKGRTTDLDAGMDAENFSTMEAAVAEDGVSPIDPQAGLMAGMCLLEEGQNPKRRWFRLKDGVLQWWPTSAKDKDKEVSCPPVGEQNLSSAVEILQYSTGLIQEINQFNFEIVFLDGKHLRLGVSNEATKARWLVALSAGIEEASRGRVAYSLPRYPPLDEDGRRRAIDKFRKQVSLYEAVQSEDHAVLQSKGMVGLDPAELTRLLYYEMDAENRGWQVTALLQSLVSLPRGEVSLQLWTEMLALCGFGESDHPDRDAASITAANKKRSVSMPSTNTTPERGGEKGGEGGGKFPSGFELIKLRSQMKAEVSSIKAQLATAVSELNDLKVENDSLRKKLLKTDGGKGSTKGKWRDSAFMARIFLGKSKDKDGGSVSAQTDLEQSRLERSGSGLKDVPVTPRLATGVTPGDAAPSTMTTTASASVAAVGSGTTHTTSKPPSDTKSQIMSMLLKKDRPKSTTLASPPVLPPLPPPSTTSVDQVSPHTTVTKESVPATTQAVLPTSASTSIKKEPGGLASVSSPTRAQVTSPAPPSGTVTAGGSTTKTSQSPAKDAVAASKANLFAMLQKRSTAPSSSASSAATTAAPAAADRVTSDLPSRSPPKAAPSLLRSLAGATSDAFKQTSPTLLTSTMSSSSLSSISSASNLAIAVPNPKRNPPMPPTLPADAAKLLGYAIVPIQGGGSGVELQPKPIYNPNTKMKSIFWTKLKPTHVIKTIWVKVSDALLSWTELEELFADDSSLTRSKSNLTNTLPSTKRLQVVTLFDKKRTQNVSIAVGRLRRNAKEIADMIIRLDPAQLNKDVTDTLIPLIPTEEELSLAQSFERPADLDLVGKLFLELGRIPRLSPRLRVQQLTFCWPEDAEKIGEGLELVGEAIEEMRSEEAEKAMQTVLGYALSIGNYMNAGSNRGQAHGVKLDILLKLGNIKPSANKATDEGNSEGSAGPIKIRYNSLLHWLVAQLQDKVPEALEFFDTCTAVWRAAKLSLKELEDNLRELIRDVDYVKEERAACATIESAAIRRPLEIRLTNFISAADERIAELTSQITSTSQGVFALREYYGETTEKPATPGGAGKEDMAGDLTACPSQAFFTLISQFAGSLKKAVAENSLRAEQAKKEEANRLAAEKRQMKANLQALTTGVIPSISRLKSEDRDLFGSDSDDDVQITSRTNRSGFPHNDKNVNSNGEPEDDVDVFTQYREAQTRSTDAMMAMFKARMNALTSGLGSSDDDGSYYDCDASEILSDEDEEEVVEGVSDPAGDYINSLTWRTTKEIL